MRVRTWSIFGAGLLAIALVGCETRDAGTGVNVDRRDGDIDVKTGPGGVDVDIDRDADGRKGVDVDVAPGRVNVDVDGAEIRERIQERREERQAQP
jgi:hypothetical protein